MTLVLVEGFDHLDASELKRKGWAGNPSPFGATPGRLPGAASQSVEVILNNPIRKLLQPFSASPSDDGWFYVIVGFAINVRNGEGGILDLYDADTLHDYILATLAVDSSQRLYIMDDVGSMVGSGATTLDSEVWNYVELKLFTGYDGLSHGSGTAEVYLNGVLEIASVSGNFDGVPIPPASNGPGMVNQIRLTAHGTGGANYFDDVYVQGSRADDLSYFGDVAVETLYPRADGTHTDWTPDTGTDHYARVNEAQSDSDASVVTTTTVGDKDSYDFDLLSVSTGSVFGAQLNVLARKNDSGTREIAPLVRQSSTDYDGPTSALSTDYQTHSWILETDPAGGAWTIAQINADEYGVDVIT